MTPSLHSDDQADDGSGGPPAVFPASGVLIGVDYGTRRVGIAISTPDRTIASPLDVLHRSDLEVEGCYFQDLCEEYRVVGLVVGLPVHLSGDEGEKAREARAFGKWLHDVTRLPVRFWDERFTTSIANDFMLEADLSRKKRKARVDKIAAQVMLQSFLESGGIDD
jgi:putative holliday junction resolvase